MLGADHRVSRALLASIHLLGAVDNRHDAHLALEVVADVDPWSDMVLRGPGFHVCLLPVPGDSVYKPVIRAVPPSASG